MIAEEENITKEATTAGFVFEPRYAGYLRSMGYVVEYITDMDTIASESDPEKKYLVGRIQTYAYPMDHPSLDVAKHQVDVPVCTCWHWRSEKSADLDEQPPDESGACKHIISAFRTERAQEDESQDTLL